MSDEYDFITHVDQAIAEDPVWSALREAIDEDTYVAHSRVDESRFSAEIQDRINNAVEELEQAAALRAAEVAHDTVRDDGSTFVDLEEHRLGPAKPTHQPDDGESVGEVMADAAQRHEDGGDA